MHLQAALSIPLGQEQLHIPKNAIRFDCAWNVQRHCNAEWEFHYIRKGECRVDVAQNQYQLRVGQALLIRPGLYHQAKTVSAELEHFTFGFTLPDGIVHQLLSQNNEPTPIFALNTGISHTIDKLWNEATAQSPYTDAYIEALIRCLIVELLRFLNIDSGFAADRVNTEEVHLTQIIDTFFEQHFADSCGEEALAKQLHFSRRHLVRILKKHYGMSFREKLNHARMDYATFLLRTTDRPVGSIGAEVGYSSESAFFKVFRQSFGMTPRQYRAIHK